MPNDAASTRPPPDLRAHAVPKWLKVTAIVAAIIVVALIIILMAASGHGPGRHGP